MKKQIMAGKAQTHNSLSGFFNHYYYYYLCMSPHQTIDMLKVFLFYVIVVLNSFTIRGVNKDPQKCNNSLKQTKTMF